MSSAWRGGTIAFLAVTDLRIREILKMGSNSVKVAVEQGAFLKLGLTAWLGYEITP